MIKLAARVSFGSILFCLADKSIGAPKALISYLGIGINACGSQFFSCFRSSLKSPSEVYVRDKPLLILLNLYGYTDQMPLSYYRPSAP